MSQKLSDPSDRAGALADKTAGQDQFQQVNRRAGYGDQFNRIMRVAREGGTLYAGEGKQIIEHYEGLLKNPQPPQHTP